MKKFWKSFLLGLGASFALIFATSCEKQKNAADGYYFEKETFVRTELTVHVVLVQSQAEMEKLLASKNKTLAPGREVVAFSVLYTNTPECTIYMMDPKVVYQPEFVGHEFVHCVYGDWHKVQP